VVTVSAGTLRSASSTSVVFPHRWTSEGVTVESEFTGAHLLYLSAAGCVLNDVYREAADSGIPVDGVRVSASGDFDRVSWASQGITYTVEIDSQAGPDLIAQLLDTVDEIAEIPRTIRAGATVKRNR
jgi:uncharacterized OsmC-like protein